MDNKVLKEIQEDSKYLKKCLTENMLTDIYYPTPELQKALDDSDIAG